MAVRRKGLNHIYYIAQLCNPLLQNKLDINFEISAHGKFITRIHNVNNSHRPKTHVKNT
jgi:hypothetical protein